MHGPYQAISYPGENREDGAWWGSSHRLPGYFNLGVHFLRYRDLYPWTVDTYLHTYLLYYQETVAAPSLLRQCLQPPPVSCSARQPLAPILFCNPLLLLDGVSENHTRSMALTSGLLLLVIVLSFNSTPVELRRQAQVRRVLSVMAVPHHVKPDDALA